jgi:hypothetical protein
MATAFFVTVRAAFTSGTVTLLYEATLLMNASGLWLIFV